MKFLKIHCANSGRVDQYGPFVCPAEDNSAAEIAEHAHRLINLPPQKLLDEPKISIAFPRLTSPRYAMVVVQQSATDSSQSTDSLDAYIVQLKAGEDVSLDDIENRLRDTYGSGVPMLDRDSLRREMLNDAHAKRCVFVARCTQHGQAIKPPANQPVIKPSEESPPLSPTSRNLPQALSFFPSMSKLHTHGAMHCFSSQSESESSLGTYERPSPLAFMDGVEARKESLKSTSQKFISESKGAPHCEEVVKAPTQLQSVLHQRDENVNLELEHGQEKPVLPQVEKVTIDEKQREVADASIKSQGQHLDDTQYREWYIQHRVHLLEHACNGECFMKDECKQVPTRESLKDIETMLRLHAGGNLDNEGTKELKDYIITHCQRCSDSGCKVPHVAAGCLPPSQLCDADGNTSQDLNSNDNFVHIRALLDNCTVNEVHALEHAYNSKCYKRDKCLQPPSADSLQHIAEMITAYNEGRLDPDSTKLFKGYILKHCQRCNDRDCNVPHRAAGCQQPGAAFEGRTSQPSVEDSLMEKVHALEHVYNGKCIMEKCKRPPCLKTVQDIETMKQAYDEGKLNPQLTEQLKNYVYVHCQRCNGDKCNIPHMMAGCPHPRASQQLNPWVYHFTDGRKAIAQPTEKDGSSVLHPYHCPKPKNHSCSPQQEVSQCEVATVSSGDESKQESHELVLENGCFPKIDKLHRHSGPIGEHRLMYCSQKLTELTGLTFGSSLAAGVDMTRSALGKGGNGYVYECLISGEKLASKQTSYRSEELTIWSQLDHDNVTSLLGVVADSASDLWRGRRSSIPIYQLMPCMTGDFQKEVNRFQTLKALIQSQKNPDNIACILRNTCFVFKEVTAGVSYLHGNRLVHGDLKGSNILISKPPICRCDHVLLCSCKHKFKVLISDFDSIRHSDNNRKSNIIVKDRLVLLRPGTLLYRSPEAHIDNVGPWCDMWSIGCTIAHLILGRTSADINIKKYGITAKKITKIFADNPLLVMLVEVTAANDMLAILRGLYGAHSGISPLVNAVEKCLHLDPPRRITAQTMHDELSQISL